MSSDNPHMVLACMSCKFCPLLSAHVQAHTPQLGQYSAADIGQMEKLIFGVVGWRLGCLTAASFLDQLLCDALSGALFHLQYQPEDYLSAARQLAAKLSSHTMPGHTHCSAASCTTQPLALSSLLHYRACCNLQPALGHAYTCLPFSSSLLDDSFAYLTGSSFVQNFSS